ncbi:TIR domain-containing protein [Aeromonas jandaei]|uniref:TIR domain-containing protein n=1 Tax=Aeromonas jandaei TaxID=650 RepID=UPI003BA0BBA6
MLYRTRTYLAGEWDGDQDAIQRLHLWNNSNNWSLSFTDAHDLTQARDNSLNCTIKKSLATRLNASKTFVLIVGDNTKSVRSGSCQYCNSYNSWTGHCAKTYRVDLRSYIDYECQKALEDELKIIVLYNAASVNKSKCPESLKDVGTHVPMCYYKDGKYFWDYEAVKAAFNG